MTQTILLVEDSPGDALLIQDVFSGVDIVVNQMGSEDYSLEWVETLSAAFDRLKQEPAPAAVLLDLSLPDGYGFQTVSQMITAVPHLPIIILTGLDDESLAVRAVQAGAQDYLVKGQVQQATLLRAIRYAIERKQEQEKLRSSEIRYRLLAENISDVVFIITPDLKIADVTPSVIQLLGYQPEELIGIPIEHLLTASSMKRATLMLNEEFSPQDMQPERDAFWSRREELELLCKKGGGQAGSIAAHSSSVWTEVKFSHLPRPEGSDQSGGLLGVARDITERRFWEETLKKANEALSVLATRDPLTGLFNRRYMTETLDRELQRACRENYPIGVAIFDLDHFKLFNDQFGHVAGDRILGELGQLLKKKTRHSDVACRYGGEEFLIVMPNATPALTMERAELIREQVGTLKIMHNGQALDTLSVSAGVAVYPYHGKDANALLNAADSALYRAKAQGRNLVFMAGD
jgi:two-component system, cell cycle response regulator